MEWARFHLGTCECGAIPLGGNALYEGLFQSIKKQYKVFFSIFESTSLHACKRRSI